MGQNRLMPATAEHLRLAPSPDEGLALRYYPVTSGDGTRLQAWTNDVAGPTVLLCNGLGTNPYAWPALLDPQCGVRIISWNHRGTGGSARPSNRNRVGIDSFVEDAIAVMDEAGIDSCVVMGWSMGVNTMFELAVRHPDRVTGLFAVAGVPGDTFSSMGAPLFLPRFVRKPLTVNAARAVRLIGKAVTPLTSRLPVTPLTVTLLEHSGFMLKTDEPDMTARAVREFITTPIDWYAHLALHSSLHLRVSLRSIDVPTAFVAGRWDLLASTKDMRTASERIPDSSYVELRGTHFIGLEQPDVVHEELLDLLDRVE